MLYFKLIAKCIGEPQRDQYYDDLEELQQDFYLESDEIQQLCEGNDLKKKWIKKDWIISISDDE